MFKIQKLMVLEFWVAFLDVVVTMNCLNCGRFERNDDLLIVNFFDDYLFMQINFE